MWRTSTEYKYIPATKFDCLMTYERFKALRVLIWYSGGTSSGDSATCNRWAFADDFVTAINTHRAKFERPCEVICVDEIMLRWYGLFHGCIDVGLLAYRAMDKNPENGCEIKSSACNCCGWKSSNHRIMIAGVTKMLKCRMERQLRRALLNRGPTVTELSAAIRTYFLWKQSTCCGVWVLVS